MRVFPTTKIKTARLGAAFRHIRSRDGSASSRCVESTLTVQLATCGDILQYTWPRARNGVIPAAVPRRQYAAGRTVSSARQPITTTTMRNTCGATAFSARESSLQAIRVPYSDALPLPKPAP